MSNFNVGDKVYCPTYGDKVYTLKANGSTIDGEFPLEIADTGMTHLMNIVTTRGMAREIGIDYKLAPLIFHANATNWEKLERFFDITLNKPVDKEVVYVHDTRYEIPLSILRRFEVKQ